MLKEKSVALCALGEDDTSNILSFYIFGGPENQFAVTNL